MFFQTLYKFNIKLILSVTSQGLLDVARTDQELMLNAIVLTNLIIGLKTELT